MGGFKEPMRLTAFRIDEATRSVADQSILIRATLKSGRVETFSDYLRNLIIEDWKRNKESLLTIGG